jgi:FtsH-binding integral membrane protein
MSKSWVEVALEEYKSLRQECLQSLTTQHTTISYGLASIGALLGSAFVAWAKTRLSAAILLLFVPTVACLVLLVWFGEATRMVRAGNYLKGLEKRISERVEDEAPALGWEGYLREHSKDGETRQIRGNYKAVVAIFLLLAALSYAGGTRQVSNLYSQAGSGVVASVAAVGMIFLGGFATYLWSLSRRLTKVA